MMRRRIRRRRIKRTRRIRRTKKIRKIRKTKRTTKNPRRTRRRNSKSDDYQVFTSTFLNFHWFIFILWFHSDFRFFFSRMTMLSVI